MPDRAYVLVGKAPLQLFWPVKFPLPSVGVIRDDERLAKPLQSGTVCLGKVGGQALALAAQEVGVERRP